MGVSRKRKTRASTGSSSRPRKEAKKQKQHAVASLKGGGNAKASSSRRSARDRRSAPPILAELEVNASVEVEFPEIEDDYDEEHEAVKENQIVSFEEQQPRGGNIRPQPKKQSTEPEKQPDYDRSDMTTPIPNKLRLFGIWKRDGKFHPCVILEKKSLKNMSEISPKSRSTFHNYRYYVHFIEFDRRMDDWVEFDDLKLESEVDGVPADKVSRPNVKESNDSHGLSHEEHTAHEEATKVKNVQSIVLGQYEMETWYFSPFSAEYAAFQKLYFCDFCLHFFGHVEELHRHARKCTLRHPPGNEIYRSEEQNTTVSVFEIDGSIQTIYCQNVCLLAKLFLDHKTLQYDTHAFLFYIVTSMSEMGHHVVGYFSKEKQCEMDNNLACILTLPCHQRKGYGRFIISFSYALSRIEGKPGSPEKPLSDLGRVSYESYWDAAIIRVLRDRGPDDSPLSIDDISQITGIYRDDVRDTLNRLQLIKYEQGEHILFIPRKLIEQSIQKENQNVDAGRVNVRECIDEKIQWTPYLLPQPKRPR